MTLISICIPTYNRANYLREALESAVEQRESDTEIIVVDDGSTDHTSEILAGFGPHKIACFYKEHTNSPDTSNRCIEEAGGEFILWLDSDDMLPAGSVKRFRETLENYPDADVFYGDIEPFGDVGSMAGKKITCMEYYNRNSLFLSRMVYSNRIPNSGTYIRKDLFERVGKFNTGYRRAHDYEFYARAVASAKFKHLGGLSIHWRWHDNNMSRGKTPVDRSFEASIVKRLVRQYPLSALFPDKGWDNPRQAGLLANSELAGIFLRYRDLESAIFHFENGLRCVNPAVALPRGRKARMEVIAEHYTRMFEASDDKYFQKMAGILHGLSTLNGRLEKA